MVAVRENLSNDPLFPFSFIYKMVGDPNHQIGNYHFHDWYEIVVVHEGTGTFFINKTSYSMEKGDIFLISGDVIHKANSSKHNPYVCSVIVFHPILINSFELGDYHSVVDLFKEINKMEEYQYRVIEKDVNQFEKLLVDMHEEYSSNKKGYRHALILLLQWMLLLINRQQNRATQQHSNSKTAKSEEWLRELLLYIDERYLDKDLTLSNVAEQALVSPEHFCRVFKQVTGLTFSSYLGTKRFIKAKELLANSTYSISYISDICGFQSTSYFHFKFKEQVGCTPGEFRKNDTNQMKQSN